MRSSSVITSPDVKLYKAKEIAWFRDRIFQWFCLNGRQLPWRETNDPYRIWISEMMCQQTGVSSVIPYYERFLKKFPSLKDLAQADEHEVLKLWEGLGYYQRARHLHKAAKIIIEKFSSQFPQTREQLLSLPGVGEYTAGAILSIAFRLSSPALDGNLIRVYSRFLGFQEPVDRPKNLKILWQLADQFKESSRERSREFIEGMMDLGALICTPKSPKCLLCPLSNRCQAYKLGVQAKIPFKEKKVKRQKKIEWVYLNIKKAKLGFLERGADEKYPHFHRLAFLSKDEAPSRFIRRLKYSVTVRDFEVYVLDEKFPYSRKLIWKTPKEVEKLLLPAIDRKILRQSGFVPN